MWGVSFEDKLSSIDGLVYRISIKEKQKQEEYAEGTNRVEDTIVAKVTGYYSVERIFRTTEELVRVNYMACNHRNLFHPDLKILRPKLYYTTINRCQEDIDFRILANLMNMANELEERGLHVIIKHVFLDARTTIYETRDPLKKRFKQQTLEEAESRGIELPVESVFYV